MKTVIKILFIVSLCLPMTLSAQWTDYGTAIYTNDNLSLGAGNNNTFSLFVRKDKSGWQGRFMNRGGVGSDVYLAHGAGYGMHIRGRTTGGQYTLQLYNQNVETNVFLNNGNVGLGLLGNVGIGTRTPSYKLQVMGNSFVEKGLVLGSGNSNHLRMIQGNYGFIHRNDGTNYYMLTTASGNQNGGWSSKRPFKVHLSTGNVVLSNNALTAIHSSKYVGIANTSPKGPLHVGQQLVIGSPSSGAWGSIAANAYWDQVHSRVERVVTGPVSEYGMTSDGDILIRTAVSAGANTAVDYKLNMIIKNNGGIGINTWQVPEDYELAVNGAILAEEVRVRPSSYWPDYVFGSDYKLMSIDKVAQYITENGHLPNMPKAEVVETEGYHVGEMDVKLLEKIEELTLYAIDADKKIEKQQQQINELAQLLNELKQQVNK